MNRRITLPALCLLCTALATSHAQTDDPKPKAADPIRAKLDKAKATYEGEWEKARKGVIEVLSKREDSARKDGNKKAVDAIKAEWEAFEERGELPKVLPAALRQKFVTDKAALEAAYRLAVKEYTKAAKDDLATAVEKEYEAFLVSAAASDGSIVTLVNKLGRLAVVTDKMGRDGPQARTGVAAKDGILHIWKVVPADAGWVYLATPDGEKFLTTDSGGWQNGAVMVLTAKKTGEALKTQQWRIVPLDKTVGEKGWVRLEQRSSGKPFGVDSDSDNVGMRLLLWDNTGQPGVQWKLEPVKKQ